MSHALHCRLTPGKRSGSARRDRPAIGSGRLAEPGESKVLEAREHCARPCPVALLQMYFGNCQK